MVRTPFNIHFNNMIYLALGSGSDIQNNLGFRNTGCKLPILFRDNLIVIQLVLVNLYSLARQGNPTGDQQGKIELIDYRYPMMAFIFANSCNQFLYTIPFRNILLRLILLKPFFVIVNIIKTFKKCILLETIQRFIFLPSIFGRLFSSIVPR